MKRMKKIITILFLLNIIFLWKIEFMSRNTRLDKIFPLHTAARDNNVEYAKYLIENGKNVNTTGIHKNTALHIAARYNYLKMAKFLIRAGADIYAKNIHRKTPLDIALKEHSQAIADLLDQEIFKRFRNKYMKEEHPNSYECSKTLAWLSTTIWVEQKPSRKAILKRRRFG